MRVLTIGRGEDCNYILDDPQKIISKKHAILRFHPLGKIEIVPLGRNNTYINGQLVPNGKPKVISRNDVISFAHVKDLNWKRIRDPYAKIRKIIFSTLFAICLLFVALLFAPNLKRCSPSNDGADIETIDDGNSGSGSPFIRDTDSASKQDIVPRKVFPSDRKTEKKDTLNNNSEDNDQKERDKKNIQIF